MFLNLICWMVIGLIAGLIAAKFVKQHGDDPKLSILLSAAGAVLGGFLFAVFSAAGLNAFNAASMWLAILGAVAALTTWHTIRSFA
jgi:uncharacterized membrane protein YeaQ/YmgE (transglycosylase-associated protein family)